MSHANMKPNEATSSELPAGSFQWGLKTIHEGTGKLSSFFSKAPVQSRNHWNCDNYIIDFGSLKNKLGEAAEVFFFYPRELDGFIESCMVATQRNTDPYNNMVSGIQVYNELMLSAQRFKAQAEEALYRQGKEVYLDMGVGKLALDTALQAGIIVNKYVYDQMENIRSIHGDYSLSPFDFVWTDNGSLCVTVYHA